MPRFNYENQETGEIIEIICSYKEREEQIEKNGKIYKRLFTAPQIGIDTKIDPFSAKDFISKTAKKQGVMADMWDRSKEMSEKRKDLNGGYDPIKEAAVKDWETSRGRSMCDAAKKQLGLI